MDCLDVRLNPRPGKLDGIAIFEKGVPVRELALGNTTKLCFVADTAHSSVPTFTVDLDRCDNATCTVVTSTSGLTIQFTPSAVVSGTLYLKATSGTTTYLARNNPPELQGGKPIIRGVFGFTLVLAVAMLGILAIGYLIYRFRPSRVRSTFPHERWR